MTKPPATATMPTTIAAVALGRSGWTYPGWTYPGWTYPGWTYPGWAGGGWCIGACCGQPGCPAGG